MKTKKILYLVVLSLLVLTFLFSIIPIPVENMKGAENPDKFIYGGLYWTSGLYQLSVKNYIGTLAYFGLFATLIGGIYLIK